MRVVARTADGQTLHVDRVTKSPVMMPAAQYPAAKISTAQKGVFVHVHLRVRNLTESISFYEGLLGLPVKVFDGGAQLGREVLLRQVQSPENERRQTKGAVLTIMHDDLQQLAMVANSINVPLAWGEGRSLWLQDPDGNSVRVVSK
jgi:catechol-2,3-dioxygenase